MATNAELKEQVKDLKAQITSLKKINEQLGADKKALTEELNHALQLNETLKGTETESKLSKAQAAKMAGVSEKAVFAWRDYPTYINVVTVDGTKIKVDK